MVIELDGGRNQPLAIFKGFKLDRQNREDVTNRSKERKKAQLRLDSMAQYCTVHK